MITNKKQFFWDLLQKNLILLLLVLLISACSKKETLKAESFKTETGWGYKITYKKKILIKQSIIPAVNDNESFFTEEDALKTGNLVVEKLKQNISPTVTKKDLILLKIKF